MLRKEMCVLTLRSTNPLIASLVFVAIPVIAVSGPALARKVTIVNQTPHAAHGKLQFPACRGDQFALSPGGKAVFEVAGCLVSRITATVDGKPAAEFSSQGSSIKNVSIVAGPGGYKIEASR
jgi:hypothetical protein